jgi:YbbR domain-containing protein
LISATLWFLSRLSDPYIYDLKIPVKYYDQDNKAYPSSFNKDTIQVKIKATGFQLVKLKMYKPFLKYQINRKADTWTPSQKKYDIQKILGKEIEILKINPEKIEINHKQLSQKTVPVYPKISIDFKSGFKNTEKPTISPSYITIFGDKNTLDSIEFISTKNYSFHKINKSLHKELELDLPQKIKTATKYVEYDLPVDQIIEIEKEIPIMIDDQNKKNTYIIIPNKAQLKYSFFKKDFHKLKQKKLWLKLDHQDLKSGKNNVKLKFDSKPEEILKYHISPSKVNVFIKEKKHD